jgi:tetratricopeptide (TPR) repeat protein
VSNYGFFICIKKPAAYQQGTAVRHPDLTPILSLPVNSDESWEGGVVNVAELFGIPPTKDQPGEGMMLVLWRSKSTDMVHARPIVLLDGDRDTLLNEFLESLVEFHNLHEFPFQPASIQCNDEALVIGLGQAVGGSGPEVNYSPHMHEWNEVLTEMANQLGENFDQPEPMPSLADSGCDEDQIREFAKAAANFYRARLWDYLNDIDLIEFEYPRPPKDMRFAVVLGAGSQTYGLGFYSDAEHHYDLMAQRADARDLSLMSLTYNSTTEINSGDVQLWRELDLPLETGEAFPSFDGFSADGPRRPTPRQLEYVTIVLQTLAETTEEEIDSGVWTKSIEYRGKQQRCKLAIPNLTEPPDRVEWMRRGLMPERRGHEKHLHMVQNFIDEQQGLLSIGELNDLVQSKFTGPMDDIEYPLETPSDRAAAKCQGAVESFGRRRIQLARQALAEDPNHVESLVLLAESTRVPERRIEAFQKAADAGRKELGSMLQDDIGYFWGLARTRPFMRACHGLAESLHAAGQSNDAIAQYEELLHLNPEDNQGVRYEVIPLMLAHNRESDATELLERYREESALWCYMKSLVEYRANGPASRKSQQAMWAAFKANEHVVTELQSAGPPHSPDAYSMGSLEEAITCIDELDEAWSEAEGYVDFMFAQYFKWTKDKQKKQQDLRRKTRKKKSASRKRRK